MGRFLPARSLRDDFSKACLTVSVVALNDGRNILTAPLEQVRTWPRLSYFYLHWEGGESSQASSYLTQQFISNLHKLIYAKLLWEQPCLIRTCPYDDGHPPEKSALTRFRWRIGISCLNPHIILPGDYNAILIFLHLLLQILQNANPLVWRYSYVRPHSKGLI